MKPLLPGLLAVLTASSALADLMVTQKMEQDSQPGATTLMTMKIKDEKVRMDVDKKFSTIVNVKSGDMQNLMHEQKMVMTVPGAMAKALQQSIPKSETADQQLEPPKPTGKKEVIAGFECEEHETTYNGSKIHIWVTKNLPSAEKAMADLAKISAEANPFGNLMQEQKLSGFPMRTVMEMPGGAGKTTVTVVALSEDPLPESDFKPPSGYQTMQMPAIPGQ